MTTFWQAIIAALKSLPKGKTVLRFFMAVWASTSSLRRKRARRCSGNPTSPTPATATSSFPPPTKDVSTLSTQETRQTEGKSKIASTSFSNHMSTRSDITDSTTSDITTATFNPNNNTDTTATSTADSFCLSDAALTTAVAAMPAPAQEATIDAFLQDAEKCLVHPVQGVALRQFAHKLHAQIRDCLLTNPACMLPSYHTHLPKGHEQGRYLSLDVGGSTLRVALIALGNQPVRAAAGANDEETAVTSGLRILNIHSFKITPTVKQLQGMAFFDWMAARIVETVNEVESRDGGCTPGAGDAAPLPMGLAWSFPIAQTSLRGGMLQRMGKGFEAVDTLLGQDLGDLMQDACAERGLRVACNAIVNDSAAALLSAAYDHPATRFGLILGTGVNMAVHLPVASVGRDKFGTRSPEWFAASSHVIINTELSMFGRGLLPLTRWDELLNAGHPKPDFQPLEHMVSGYYLGEVCRFALTEAIQTAGLLGGVVPPSLRQSYSLDTETLSQIESDESPDLANAIAVFEQRHPSSVRPTYADMAALRTLAAFISQRSAALVAASICAMRAVKLEAEQALISQALHEGESTSAADTARMELEVVQARTVVAFNGSVIERYPHYLERCRELIRTLLEDCVSDSDINSRAVSDMPGPVDLVPANESSLQGAAVALACLDA